MKKIALISSFCDTQDKIELLIKNVKKIKSLEIDVMVISPLKLTDELINLCDYFLYTKENAVLNWPEKAYFQWWGGTFNGININMTMTYPDYGYAALLQFKRIADLALSMGYDIFFLPPLFGSVILESQFSLPDLPSKATSVPSFCCKKILPSP